MPEQRPLQGRGSQALGHLERVRMDISGLRAGSAADGEAWDPQEERRWEGKRCVLKKNEQEGGGERMTKSRSNLRTEGDGSGETGPGGC